MKIVHCLLVTLLVCLLTGTQHLLAQQYPYKAKVKLVNQEIVRGYLTEPWLGGTMQLQLSPKSYITLDSADIRKVTLVDVHKRKVMSVNRGASHTGAYSLKNGFYHQLNLGLAFGESGIRENLGMITGYWIRKRMTLGVGINYDRYARVAALPIYLQPRFYLKHDKSSLYYFTDLGYAPAWLHEGSENNYDKISARGGFMGQGGVGYHLNFAKSALTFTLGYKLQQTQIHSEFFSYVFDPTENGEATVGPKIADWQERRLNRRIVFTMGIML